VKPGDPLAVIRLWSPNSDLTDAEILQIVDTAVLDGGWWNPLHRSLKDGFTVHAGHAK
jgi:hypothetical protein